MHLWYVALVLALLWANNLQGWYGGVKAADVGQGSQGQYSIDQDRTSIHRREIESNSVQSDVESRCPHFARSRLVLAPSDDWWYTSSCGSNFVIP
jgi:hypothetical protein